MHVPVAYREPFAIGRDCYVDRRPHGESVLEIVRSVPNLPAQFLQRGAVLINGERVPRELWAHVRPKPTCANFPIAVTLHMPLGDGGGGNSTLKTVGAIVAAIALVVITQGIASGAAAGLLGSTFAAGTIGAQILAGAVAVGGALAISALTAPPTTQGPATELGGDNLEQKEAAAASGNVLERGGAVPRVIGTRKVFPPFAFEPIVELVGNDEYVEALYILNGPHLLEDPRLDGVSITEAEDVEYEMREGWSTDTPVTLTQRQGRTLTPNILLSEHDLGDNGSDLADQSLPENCLPIFHGVASRNSPDEIWLHLLLPGGLQDTANASANSTIAFRIRFRKRGDTDWINLPELHLSDKKTQQLRRAIIFKWATSESATPPATNGWVAAWVEVPRQTVAPADPVGPQWESHSYFDDGIGDPSLYSTTVTTRVRRVALYDNRVEVFLDENTFPKGIYEFEIKRSYVFRNNLLNTTTYNYDGIRISNFFKYFTNAGTDQVDQDQSGVTGKVSLLRCISIWNEYPVNQTGFAMVAVRAINRSISRFSVQASGWVRDWDGSGWNNWVTTSNPAPHYADILSGAQNIDPLPADLRDDAGLTAWRDLCTTYGWTCDAIINDMRTQDALQLLASCAYARPYQSDVYGVIVDHDVSAQSPVQVFSRRNSANMRFERAFARLPAGFNVTYRDESLDDDQAQVTVYQRNPTNADLTLLESITYEGIVDEGKVIARAQFDLDQVNLRSTFYYLDVDIESIVCRRGSLVGVQHDVLTDRAGDGYIYRKTTSGPNITGVVLDAEIPITTTTDMHGLADMHAVTDMHDVGITTGIVVRRTDGTLSTHALSNATGSSATLTFSNPITDTATIQGFDDNDRKYGCMIVAGRIESIYRRLLVHSITPQRDLTAVMVMVDEAPELVRYNEAGGQLLKRAAMAQTQLQIQRRRPHPQLWNYKEGNRSLPT